MLLSVNAVIIKSKYRSHSPTFTTTYPTMSGRGKGKGLRKGGAKRHRKVLCDNIQGITKPAIHRLAHRGGGVKHISSLIYEETWYPKGLSWECHQGLGYLHGSHEEEDCHVVSLLMWGEDLNYHGCCMLDIRSKCHGFGRADLFEFLLWLCREGREREKTLTLNCRRPSNFFYFENIV